MEKGKNKDMWIWIVVIVLVVGGILIAVKMNKSETNVAVVETPTPDALQVTEDTSAGSIDMPAKTGVAPVTISYVNALAKYKDSRIQLAPGTTCAASPSNVTYKNGTTIMIDNRAPVARTLKIGVTYSVKGYGFKLIKLSSAKVPATWLVDCDGQQNVATILLQK
jgi:hypothetical protein